MPNKVWNNIESVTIRERAQIIDTILQFKKTNNWFDDNDLSYFLKMLLENGYVYVSKEAYKVIECFDKSETRFSKDIREQLKQHGMPKEYLQEKTHGTCRDWGQENELVWEHVVPTKVILSMLKKSNYDLSKMIKLGNVCIVLKSEDSRLTKMGLKEKMPKNWSTDDVWARYKEAKIAVVGDPFTIE